MPSSALKSLAGKSDKSLADLEKYWQEAKGQVPSDVDNKYAYMMGIVKKRAGISEEAWDIFTEEEWIEFFEMLEKTSTPQILNESQILYDIEKHVLELLAQKKNQEEIKKAIQVQFKLSKEDSDYINNIIDMMFRHGIEDGSYFVENKIHEDYDWHLAGYWIYDTESGAKIAGPFDSLGRAAFKMERDFVDPYENDLDIEYFEEEVNEGEKLDKLKDKLSDVSGRIAYGTVMALIAPIYWSLILAGKAVKKAAVLTALVVTYPFIAPGMIKGALEEWWEKNVSKKDESHLYESELIYDIEKYVVQLFQQGGTSIEEIKKAVADKFNLSKDDADYINGLIDQIALEGGLSEAKIKSLREWTDVWPNDGSISVYPGDRIKGTSKTGLKIDIPPGRYTLAGGGRNTTILVDPDSDISYTVSSDDIKDISEKMNEELAGNYYIVEPITGHIFDGPFQSSREARRVLSLYPRQHAMGNLENGSYDYNIERIDFKMEKKLIEAGVKVAAGMDEIITTAINFAKKSSRGDYQETDNIDLFAWLNREILPKYNNPNVLDLGDGRYLLIQYGSSGQAYAFIYRMSESLKEKTEPANRKELKIAAPTIKEALTADWDSEYPTQKSFMDAVENTFGAGNYTILLTTHNTGWYVNVFDKAGKVYFGSYSDTAGGMETMEQSASGRRLFLTDKKGAKEITKQEFLKL